MSPGLPFQIGRAAGLISAGASCFLWLLAMWAPAPSVAFSSMSMVVILIMLFLAMLALVAAWRGHGKALVVLFAISFFPIGLSMLSIDHWIHWVGFSQIGLLLAGLILWPYSPRRRAESDNV